MFYQLFPPPLACFLFKGPVCFTRSADTLPGFGENIIVIIIIIIINNDDNNLVHLHFVLFFYFSFRCNFVFFLIELGCSGSSVK